VFSLAALYAIPRLLIAVLMKDEPVWKPLGYAMDRVLAVLFGYSGQYTLSACLGTGARHQWLRKIVDSLEAGHCEKAAKAEGLLK
jgi:hypothetical protein